MSIFTRFKDIVTSNLNSMLDKAEDPEKMIRLMIQEMEETLVELKASCASIMADKKKIERTIAELKLEFVKWDDRASLALSKGREDLAREAIREKQRYENYIDEQSFQSSKFDALIDQTHQDITRLEEKISSARKKQSLLIQRHVQANNKIRSEKNIRNASSQNATIRFEQLEQKIDRLEAEANLINPQPKQNQSTLENEFSRLENNDKVEDELEKLKKRLNTDTPKN